MRLDRPPVDGERHVAQRLPAEELVEGLRQFLAVVDPRQPEVLAPAAGAPSVHGEIPVATRPRWPPILSGTFLPSYIRSFLSLFRCMHSLTSLFAPDSSEPRLALSLSPPPSLPPSLSLSLSLSRSSDSDARARAQAREAEQTRRR